MNNVLDDLILKISERIDVQLKIIPKVEDPALNYGFHKSLETFKECRMMVEDMKDHYNEPLSLEQLKAMEGEPIWIEVLDRPDLSRWHFIVRTNSLGLIAKDGLGQYECYPHNEKQMTFSGCYFDIEKGHNYGVNWLAYRQKVNHQN